MSMLCEVYRSPRKAEMYLYVERGALKKIPEPLLQQFGEPELVMTLSLTQQRRLARADVNEVIEQIRAQGFYLQLPPAPADLLRRGKDEH